jgi:hypothetical protein
LQQIRHLVRSVELAGQISLGTKSLMVIEIDRQPQQRLRGDGIERGAITV